MCGLAGWLLATEGSSVLTLPLPFLPSRPSSMSGSSLPQSFFFAFCCYWSHFTGSRARRSREHKMSRTDRQSKIKKIIR
jgi:hypothetical protein